MDTSTGLSARGTTVARGPSLGIYHVGDWEGCYSSDVSERLIRDAVGETRSQWLVINVPLVQDSVDSTWMAVDPPHGPTQKDIKYAIDYGLSLGLRIAVRMVRLARQICVVAYGCNIIIFTDRRLSFAAAASTGYSD